MVTSKLSQLKHTLFFFISSFLIISTAQLTYINHNCYDAFGTYNILSDYSKNIETSISSLASKASTTYYDTHTVGSGDGKVNAYFSCRYDVSPEVCQRCVATTASNISSCIGSVETLIAYEECTLHYSNRTIFSIMEDLPQLYEFSLNFNKDDDVEYSPFLNNHITDLINDAASSASPQYFATTTAKYSSSETIYALAQCNPDITTIECTTCLRAGFGNFTNTYTNRVYGQIFMPSCRISYILTSDEISPPWKFAQTFSPNLRPILIPKFIKPTPIIPIKPIKPIKPINLGPSSDPSSIDLGPSSVPESSDFGPNSVPESSDLSPNSPNSVPEFSDLGPSFAPESSNLGPSSVPESSNLEPSSSPGSSNLAPSSFPGFNDLGSAGTKSSSTTGAMIGIIFCVAKFLF